MRYQPKGATQVAVLKHLAENGPTFEDDLVRELGGDDLVVRGALTCCRQGKAVTRSVEIYGNGTGWLYALVGTVEPSCVARVPSRPAVLFLKMATDIHDQRDHAARVRMIGALCDEAVGPVLSWLHYQASLCARSSARPSTPEARRLERELLAHIQATTGIAP